MTLLAQTVEGVEDGDDDGDDDDNNSDVSVKEKTITRIMMKTAD